MIFGKYCISSMRDTSFEGGSSFLKMNMIDIISKRPVQGGVIWLSSKDTTQIIYETSSIEKRINPGKYIIDISNLEHLGLRINVTIPRNKIVIINTYLGNSLQF